MLDNVRIHGLPHISSKRVWCDLAWMGGPGKQISKVIMRQLHAFDVRSQISRAYFNTMICHRPGGGPGSTSLLVVHPGQN